MGWLLFAVFLYVACAVLIVAEVFLPSGGILSVCALACVAGGITVCFHSSMLAGWLGVLVAAVMVPSLLVGAYKVLPMTRFGQRVILARPVRERGDALTDGPELAKLLGHIGEVLTPLRPVGTCNFDGCRVECAAEGQYIQVGQMVRVIRVEGMQPTVRAIDEV